MSDEELAGVLGLAMDRRAMELLFAVAEASTTRLPRSEKTSQEVEHGELPVIPIGSLAEASSTPESNPEPAQTLVAEWVTRSSNYTRQIVQRLNQDWEQRLQRMCNQGQKGAQGMGAAKAIQRRREWNGSPP
ncbi:hypothetical protein CYMTET_26623 [Cymbomonas tetramitiformis]|uniref:Uncharacterized protein n=1 Tax=Cymbomonas tetramitiformis TaxID=36881 RepID=A0AAE0FMS1_9CHLO|nr:hypothetical protein CYMTET_28621 [Cymbomonas tetramitiformis]KAK3264650.1 hypothetical protein CYMTET_26623 [Cymbomonas tetramitiformis]